MRTERGMSDMAVVIRTWNNAPVENQVQNFLAMNVGKIIVVVNAKPDKSSTKEFLGGLLKDPRVQLIEMFEGYNWSSALNVALMAIQMANVKARTSNEAEFRFLLNVSVEAEFTKEHVETMLDAAADDSKIGVVGTSFQGYKNGEAITLGKPYHYPRNTGMLIKLETFGPLWDGFDTWCDSTGGGMEDFDFILKMKTLSCLQVKHLDLKVPLRVGVNFHQPSKEKREKETMERIITRWRSFFNEGTKERKRIEDVIKEMEL